MTGSGRYGILRNRERFIANASASAYADLRLLGERKRAAYFRANLGVNATLLTTTSGSPVSNSCSNSASIYMKVGNTVLWNWSGGSVFDAHRDYRIRIMTPTLVVWFGGGALVAKASGYGRINTDLRCTIIPCWGYVRMNGNARVSGNGYFSASAYTILAAASINGTFVCNDQRLEARDFTVFPRTTQLSEWVNGLVRLHSGSMRGYIKLSAILPPFIPVSTTIANWSKSATTKTLVNQ